MVDLLPMGTPPLVPARRLLAKPLAVSQTVGVASGCEEAPNGGRRFFSLVRELDGAYVVRLGTFRALCCVELHALTFIERPEPG